MARTVAQISQEIADREAVRDCLMRYCRGVDRCDKELLHSAYWPGAIDDHGVFNGTAEDFIEFLIPVMQSMDQTMHLLGNILIDILGNKANVETYFQAYHGVPGESEDYQDIVVLGRYVDKFEKRGDEWRIARRVVIIDAYRHFPDSADWSQPLFGHHYQPGGRCPDDQSYRLFSDTE